jgi:group II intron reverse transcriptase/maturase
MSLTLSSLANKAKEEKDVAFSSIAHLMDVELLRESHKQLRKQASAGVDGVTWREYDDGLEGKLRQLHERLRNKTYRARPARRVLIPKDNGKERPIGVAAHEDKIVQRATVTLLSCIYEQDFLDCSYGFRPQRSAHDALDATFRMLQHGKANWILDADIASFFDELDRKWLMEFLQHRVRDGSILRLIAKWLHAGVLEGERRTNTGEGSVQGAVISPLLANLYLHYVLDLWIEKVVKPRSRGAVQLIRYCDDFIIGFENKEDAEQVNEALKARLSKFGLRLNEEKTRLISFGRKAWQDWKNKGGPKPPTFNFLGLTHACGTSLKGRFLVQRTTMSKRMHNAVRRVADWCRDHRHLDIQEQCAHLNRVLRGHFNYYGVSGNRPQIRAFHYWVMCTWRKWLRRRSHRARKLNWDAFNELLRRHRLVQPRITHPYPPWQTKVAVF